MINDKLNTLLANYAVVAHKTQNFHWYIKGHTFFNTHAKLEEFYDQMFDQIDEVAELVLQNGGQPIASMAGFLKAATIEEAEDGFKEVNALFATVKSDFESLRSLAADIKKDADAEDNYLVSAAMDEHIALLSKHIWMIGQSQM